MRLSAAVLATEQHRRHRTHALASPQPQPHPRTVRRPHDVTRVSCCTLVLRSHGCPWVNEFGLNVSFSVHALTQVVYGYTARALRPTSGRRCPRHEVVRVPDPLCVYSHLAITPEVGGV